MPSYKYECKVESCLHRFDKFCSIQESLNVDCEVCGGETIKILTPVSLNFPGDGWISKNLRIARQMQEKNKKLDAKQQERLFYSRDIPKLAPNVGGEETGSWADAQKLAKDRGLNTASYDKVVAKEKAEKIK